MFMGVNAFRIGEWFPAPLPIFMAPGLAADVVASECEDEEKGRSDAPRRVRAGELLDGSLEISILRNVIFL